MTQEDYCSYELSQLLKEKGFEGVCEYAYSNKGNYFEVDRGNFDEVYCLRPTHQMAMKWLREVHHIEILITFGFPFIDGKEQYKYFWSAVIVCNNHLEYPMNDPNNVVYSEEMADSYEEAVEAALKYSLENLI